MSEKPIPDKSLTASSKDINYKPGSSEHPQDDSVTDREVLMREIECVCRKSRLNCSDCARCDLVLADGEALKALVNAVIALGGDLDE